MKTTDEKLKDLQDSILKDMNEEEELEKLTDGIAEDIFRRLLQSKKCDYEVNDVAYRFILGYTDKKIVVSALNIKRFKILGMKYKPFFISADIEEGFTFEETLLSCIKAFVKKEYGIIKAEEM